MSRVDHAMVVRDSIDQQRRSGAGAPDIWGMSSHVAPQPAWGPGGAGLPQQLQGGLPAIGPTQQVPTYLRQQMVARAITPDRQPMGDPAPVPAWGQQVSAADQAAINARLSPRQIPPQAVVPEFLKDRRLVPNFRAAGSPEVIETAMALGGESAARIANPERLNQAMGVVDGEVAVPDRQLLQVSGGVSTASADLPANLVGVGGQIALDAAASLPSRSQVDLGGVNRAAAATGDLGPELLLSTPGGGGGGGNPPVDPPNSRPPRRLRVPRGAAGGAAQAAAAADQYGWARTMESALDLPRPVAAAEAALARHASNTALRDAAPRLHALTQSAGKLGIGAMRWALPAAGVAMVGAPIVSGALEGNATAGGGGAVIGGGAATVGAGVGFAFGGPVGAVIGSQVGGLVSQPLVNAAKGAVEAYESGDTGVVGTVGQLLSPVITSERDKQQAAVVRMKNDPATLAILQQEERRRSAERTAMLEQAALQSYLS